MVAQLRRAAVSVPSNIAEGQARRTTGEFVQFISHAEGSLAELDTQVHIAQQLGYGSSEELANIANQIYELRRMLNALRRRHPSHGGPSPTAPSPIARRPPTVEWRPITHRPITV